MTDEELIKKYVSLDKQNEAYEKLMKGYPVQYIIGDVEFFDTKIKVNENVLIPRFETEYLVEKTINYLKKLHITNPKVLEVGTGSGCISISLKKHFNCEIDAMDISHEALLVAKENALLNEVNINFIEQDIKDFNALNNYDVIISNPPYIKKGALVDEKTKYEPEIALYAPLDGIYFYKVILEKVYQNLNSNYLIAFEIGYDEKDLVTKLTKKYLPNAYIKTEKDYNNYDRYVFITNKMLKTN